MPTVIRTGTLKTRKPHKCHGCRKDIPIGECVEAQTCAFDGHVYTLHTCEDCQRLFAKIPHDYFDSDEGVPEGWVKEMRQEGML